MFEQAPCRHGEDTHSSSSSAHLGPVQPTGHAHENPLLSSVHAAPFWQGALAHFGASSGTSSGTAARAQEPGVPPVPGRQEHAGAAGPEVEQRLSAGQVTLAQGVAES